MKPITLNIADVKAKARKAFLAGELQCQKYQASIAAGEGRAGVYSCDYTGPCVIGVSLTKYQRQRLDAGNDETGVGFYIDTGAIITDDGDGLIALQMAHDEAMDYDGSDSSAALDNLRQLLDITVEEAAIPTA